MYTVERGLLTGWDGGVEIACIPEGVTTIGKGAFRNSKGLCAVILPASARTIGDHAFEGCRDLKQIVLQSGIKRMGNGCFRDCVALRRIELPGTVTSIHANAFENCCSLEEIALPDALRRNIEVRTFADCGALKSIVIPSGIQQIKRGAFSGCVELREVGFENKDILIDRTAFQGCINLEDETRLFIQSHVMEENTVDIHSGAAGAAGRLSNYTERHFIFDGTECHSIEGVLQSLKCPDPVRQREICLLTGSQAKKAGGEYEWRNDQVLYWQGKPYPRRSDEYSQLLDRLYDAVFEQDAAFRADLASLRGHSINHQMGLTNPSETVLTRMEFIGQMQRLIERTM